VCFDDPISEGAKTDPISKAQPDPISEAQPDMDSLSQFFSEL
jgi:hypothetical protein